MCVHQAFLGDIWADSQTVEVTFFFSCSGLLVLPEDVDHPDIDSLSRPQELISQAGQDVVHDPSHDERVRQYAEVSLKGQLLEKDWCTLVPQQLKSSEHDHREKVLIWNH